MQRQRASSCREPSAELLAQECREVEVRFFHALLETADAAPRSRLAALDTELDIAAAGATDDHVGQDCLLLAIGTLVNEQVIATEAPLLQLVLERVELVLTEGHRLRVARMVDVDRGP